MIIVKVATVNTGNPGTGAGAARIENVKGKREKKDFTVDPYNVSFGREDITSSRMELSTIVVALESILDTEQENLPKIRVITTSAYVVMAFGDGRWFSKAQKNGFKGKANDDLWIRLDAALKALKAECRTTVEFVRVKRSVLKSDAVLSELVDICIGLILADQEIKVKESREPVKSDKTSDKPKNPKRAGRSAKK